MTTPTPEHPALTAVRKSGSSKVKVAVSDIDGVLRGKYLQVETFRVGCIGAIGRNEMRQAVAAVADVMREMGIASGAAAL